MKKLFVNMLLVIVSTFIGLVLCEIGLRQYYFRSLNEPLPEVSLRQPHSIFGWSLQPNKTAFQQTLDYTVRVSINSKGLRDIEHAYEKKNGVFRIVILGDSFIEAYQVPLEKSMHRLLEKNLSKKISNKIEVINLGVGGYGTAQEYLYLRDEGLKYRPNLVILAFLAFNDVRNNSRILEKKLYKSEDVFKVVARPFFSFNSKGELVLEEPDFNKTLGIAEKTITRLKRKSYNRKLKEKLLLYRMLDQKIRKMTQGDHYPAYDIDAMLGVYYSESTDDWQEAWGITKNMILMIKAISEKNGANFLLVSVPDKFQVEEEYFNRSMSKYLIKKPELNVDPQKPENTLKLFCMKNDIEFLSLLEEFRSYYKKTQKKLHHSKKDLHWNKTGHELASELVSEYCLKRGYVKN